MKGRNLGSVLFAAGLILAVGPGALLVWAHHMYVVGVTRGAWPFAAAYIAFSLTMMAAGAWLIWWSATANRSSNTP